MRLITWTSSRNCLYIVPKDSIQFHVERGDFANWIREVLDDSKLADGIEGLLERHELTKSSGSGGNSYGVI